MKKRLFVSFILCLTFYPVLYAQENDSVFRNSTETKVFEIDSLDLEPKFIDYAFLELEGNKRKKSYKPTYTTQNSIKECIQRHILNHFRYPKSAQRKNLQGKIMVTLLFLKDGNLEVKEVLGEHLALSNKAKRIASLFPKRIIPGLKNGETVSSSIQFPIEFKLFTIKF